MGNSINGSVLHVDLTNKKLTTENPTDKFYRTYGGGSAMGLYYILNSMPPGTDALSPKTVLTFFTGLPTGLAISGQSRLCVNARSPISGAIGDSQSGGFFPAALKGTGFDGIVVQGRSDQPVYLYIENGTAELRDASHLWGLTTAEVETRVKADLGDEKLEILQIGPAGEKQVRISSIMSMCNRANGRTGMGAVMGSKLLKAIVIKSTAKVTAADPKAVSVLARSGAKDLDTILDVKGLNINGTADVVAFQNMYGSLPTRNYREAQFEDFADIAGDRLTDTILKDRDTCYACVVRCKRVVETEYNGRAVLPVYGGPEYETIATMGSYCGVHDLKAIALANQLCNAYGLDTIATGATIAFAIECFENGLITTTDTGGMVLRFGDPDVVINLVEKIARREGIGDLLAEGSERAAEKVGRNAVDYLITFKGTEAPAHMPQAKRTLELIYAVNPFGADHQSSEHDP
ncbi:MAG: aldehyde:ferredoxin oxidoreductase, partial [Anaerolineaceae bacterium]|nr:aldehyde:ferredoxin oxidoreductase [Anaerolineaceae bacterium]